MSSCDARTSRRTTSPEGVPAEAGTKARPATSRRPPSAATALRAGSEARRMATSVSSGDRINRLRVRFAVAVPDPFRGDAHGDAEPARDLGDPSLGGGVITGRDSEGLAVARMHLDDRAHDRRCARPWAEGAGRAHDVWRRVVLVEP